MGTPEEVKEKKRVLPPKVRLFIAEYPKDYNATQAAIRAGYSPKTAYSQGQRLLKNDEISGALENDLRERLRKIGVQSERVLTEMARISFNDPRKLFNADHSLKQPQEWDDDMAACIAGIEVFEEYEGRGENRELIGHTKKIKIFDKTKTLEQLGKHLKLFTDRTEMTGEDGGPVVLRVVFDKKKGNGANGGNGGE